MNTFPRPWHVCSASEVWANPSGALFIAPFRHIHKGVIYNKPGALLQQRQWQRGKKVLIHCRQVVDADDDEASLVRVPSRLWPCCRSVYRLSATSWQRRSCHFEETLHCDAIAAAVYANIDGSTPFARMTLLWKPLCLLSFWRNIAVSTNIDGSTRFPRMMLNQKTLFLLMLSFQMPLFRRVITWFECHRWLCCKSVYGLAATSWQLNHRHYEETLHCDAIAAVVYTNIDGSTTFARMTLLWKPLFLMMVGF